MFEQFYFTLQYVYMLIIYLCQTEIPSQRLLIDKEHLFGSSYYNINTINRHQSDWVMCSLNVNINLGMDPLIFRGAGNFLKKIVSFPTRAKKNKMSSTKLKIKSLFFVQCIFSKPLYKCLQIT